MEIREAEASDLEQILSLFEGTIQHINAKDYTEAQIDVWSGAKNRTIWLDKIASQSFYVCIVDNLVVGFGSIDSVGYLDFMYVHKDYQRKGIAAALLQTIEKKAAKLKIERIWSSVSKTAQPFFSKHGYSHFDDEHKMVSGVHFKNALMEKRLS